MEKKVENIIRKVLEIGDDIILNDNMKIGSIPEWDSLANMTLICCIENEYRFRFEFDEILELDTIESIKKIINKKVNGND